MGKNKAKLKVPSQEDLNKKYGKSNALEIHAEVQSLLRIPSRCLWLNYQTGGGLVYGRIHEVFGYESTGKTLLALDFAYVTQSLGGVVLWDDAERCFDYAWAEELGIDLSRLVVYEKNDIEGFADWARDQSLYWRSKLTKNEPILLVCDSIAALETLENINADMVDGKAKMGNRAKKIYEFYRERNDLFVDLGITVYMVNQVRKKLGMSMFEMSETQPGGEATKFYSSIRISLFRGKQIKGRVVKGEFKEDLKNGKKVGNYIYVGVEKNKTHPPKARVKTKVFFFPSVYGYVGYSKYDGFEEILLDEGIIKKKGSRYYYKHKKELKLICNGHDNITSMIEGDDLIRRTLIKKSGVNTISKTREKLEGLSRNIYPITNSVKKGKLLSE